MRPPVPVSVEEGPALRKTAQNSRQVGSFRLQSARGPRMLADRTPYHCSRVPPYRIATMPKAVIALARRAAMVVAVEAAAAASVRQEATSCSSAEVGRISALNGRDRDQTDSRSSLAAEGTAGSTAALHSAS